MLIDDDADDRAIFCEALQEAAPEFICFTANSGRNALLAFEQKQVAIPDLIFMDVNMPVMTGWQLLTLLKERAELRQIPVIMYSTSTLEDEVEKTQRLGALCYFAKPARFSELRRSLVLVVGHLRTNSLESLVQESALFLVSTPG